MSPIRSRVQFVLLFLFGQCICLCVCSSMRATVVCAHISLLHLIEYFRWLCHFRPLWLAAQVACPYPSCTDCLQSSDLMSQPDCQCFFVFFFADLFCETSSTFFLKVEVRANHVKHYVKLLAEPTQQACSKDACSLWTSSRWMLSKFSPLPLFVRKPSRCPFKKKRALVLSATSCREYQEVFNK